MSLDLSNSNVFVALVVLPGCPACEDMRPRFDRAAARLRRRNPTLPIGVYSANDQREEVQAFLNRFEVYEMPTLLVLCRGPGSVSIVGSVDSNTLDYYMDLAEQVHRSA